MLKGKKPSWMGEERQRKILKIVAWAQKNKKPVLKLTDKEAQAAATGRA